MVKLTINQLQIPPFSFLFRGWFIQRLKLLGGFKDFLFSPGIWDGWAVHLYIFQGLKPPTSYGVLICQALLRYELQTLKRHKAPGPPAFGGGWKPGGHDMHRSGRQVIIVCSSGILTNGTGLWWLGNKWLHP